MVPDDVELGADTLTPLEPLISAPVDGRRLWPAGAADVPVGTHLRVGGQGVSLMLPGSKVVTVAFEDCATLLRSPDGRRVLIGFDYATVDVDSRWWAGASSVTSLIDAGVPSDRHVDVEKQPVQQAERRRVNWRGFASGPIFVVGALVMLVTFDAGRDHPLSPGGLLFFSMFAIIVLDLVVSFWRWNRWESGS